MVEVPATRASLLVRLRDPRDEAAWREFVDLYAPLLYHYARKQGLQDADAVDLSQEVISTVASAVGQLDYDPRRGTFRGWLFTILRRKLSNWWRDRKLRPLASGNSADHRRLAECPAADSEVDWDAEWQERVYAWACEQVRREVSVATWEAFWRTAIDGQPGKQVATTLDLTVAAVYHARSRVLARLKALVQAAQES